MTNMRLTAAVVFSAVLFSGAAIAQDKPSVAKYLSEGYDVLRVEIGNPFLQFVLKKDKTLVWCSVQVQTGETSSCRTIK
ncbi:MAG: hypothetical protein WCI56_04310 [Hyphomicrobiales bacterium]